MKLAQSGPLAPLFSLAVLPLAIRPAMAGPIVPTKMLSRVGSLRIAAMVGVAMLALDGSAHAQLTGSDFQSYNPASASSITPGLFSLYSLPVDSLIPTQINVGNAETTAKANSFDLIPNTAALTADLLGEIEPVVIGPNGQLYQTDGH